MPFYSNKDYIRLMRPLPQCVARDIYDIPYIEAQEIDLSALNNEKWLVNMKNAKATDTNASRKIVHAFCYDDVLYRAYNDPMRFLLRVAKYYAIASFDFSMHEGMDFRQILGATYDNRWSGAFLQANGKNALATVGWVNKEYDDVCFAGLRNGGTFMISTLGVNNVACEASFLRGYYEMRTRFPDSKIICVGNAIPGMDLDVFFVRYEESFGNWEQYPGFWQTRFLNADGTLFLGGDV